MWGATYIISTEEMQLIFQSTLPVWGATGGVYIKADYIFISIHAPRVGSDKAAAVKYRIK